MILATAARVAVAVLAVAAAVVCCLNGAWLGWAGWTVTAWLVATRIVTGTGDGPGEWFPRPDPGVTVEGRR